MDSGRAAVSSADFYVFDDPFKSTAMRGYAGPEDFADIQRNQAVATGHELSHVSTNRGDVALASSIGLIGPDVKSSATASGALKGWMEGCLGN